MAGLTIYPPRNWRRIDIPKLDNLLGSRSGIDEIVSLRGPDAAAVMNLLDQALDLPDIDERRAHSYTRTLRKLCGSCGSLPTSHTLPEGVEIISPQPHTSGGFADVWVGRYNGRTVAVKALKIYGKDDVDNIKKRFFKETLVWKRLSHPNVLPFRGVANIPQFSFCMVSDWMPHGNLMEYIRFRPEANRLLLLSDIACGLDYLHRKELVHGDLKGVNILVNNDYRAVIADFGLVAVLSTSSTLTYMTSALAGGGSERWMAPELLYPEKYGFSHSIPSKESDTYAFGMVIYEVMTGDIPFSRDNRTTIIFKVVQGSRPERPPNAAAIGLSDSLWQIVEDCWREEFAKRSPVRIVLDQLNHITRHWVSPAHAEPISRLSSATNHSSVLSTRLAYLVGDPDDELTDPIVPSIDGSRIGQETSYNEAEESPPLTPEAFPPQDFELQPVSEEAVFEFDPGWTNSIQDFILTPLSHYETSPTFSNETESEYSAEPSIKEESPPTPTESKPFTYEVKIAVLGCGDDDGAPATAKKLVRALSDFFVRESDREKVKSPGRRGIATSPILSTISGRLISKSSASWSGMTQNWPKTTLIDMPGKRSNFIKLLFEGQSQGDGAVVVVSGKPTGSAMRKIAIEAKTREQLFLAYTMGIMNIVIVISRMEKTFPWDNPKEEFLKVRDRTSEILKEIGYTPNSVVYVPMGASFGEKVMDYHMPEWFKGWRKETTSGPITGHTLREAIDSIAAPSRRLAYPLRVAVLRKVNGKRKERNHFVCRVLSGILRHGTSLTFCPGDFEHTVAEMVIESKIVEEAHPGEEVDLYFANFSPADEPFTRQMAYQSGKVPVRRAASFIARIVINADRAGISVGNFFRLSIYGLEFLCRLQEVLQIKDRSGAIVDTRQTNLKDGETCRVALVPTSANSPNAPPPQLSGVTRCYYGPLFIEPYHEFSDLGRIALDLDFEYPGMASNLVAVGVVESVQYM